MEIKGKAFGLGEGSEAEGLGRGGALPVNHDGETPTSCHNKGLELIRLCKT